MLHSSVENLNYINITGTVGQKWSIHGVISEEKKKNKRQKILATGDFEGSITIDPFFYTKAGSQFSIRIHPQDRSTAEEIASLENRWPH